VCVTFPLSRHGLQYYILKVPGTTVHHPVVRGIFVPRVSADRLPKPVVFTCNVLSGSRKNTDASGNGKLAAKKGSLRTAKKRSFLSQILMVCEDQGLECEGGDYLELFGREDLYCSPISDEQIADNGFERSFKIAHPTIVAARTNGPCHELDLATLIPNVFVARHDSLIADVALIGRKQLNHPVAKNMLGAVGLARAKGALLH
jgi:hypothetical protein